MVYVTFRDTSEGRRFIRHDQHRGFVNASLVDEAMPWVSEVDLPPPPGWKLEQRPPTSRELAHVLWWAGEWSELEPGEVDRSYLLGVRETIGHILAGWLVQSAGYKSCSTADAIRLVPWDELTEWGINQWQAFLLKLAREPR